MITLCRWKSNCSKNSDYNLSHRHWNGTFKRWLKRKWENHFPFKWSNPLFIAHHYLKKNFIFRIYYLHIKVLRKCLYTVINKVYVLFDLFGIIKWKFAEIFILLICRVGAAMPMPPELMELYTLYQQELETSSKNEKETKLISDLNVMMRVNRKIYIILLLKVLSYNRFLSFNCIPTIC